MGGLLLLGITILFSMTMSSPEGPHGGIIKKAEDYHIEIKNSPDTLFFAYLLNKKLNPISNKGISGDARFFFPDSTVFNVRLEPIAEDAFKASTISGFYACKVNFNVFGKSVSAVFEKQQQIVRRK